MRYLDFFEDVYYINLDYRTDRKELFEKRAEEVGIINPNRLSAFQPTEEQAKRPMFKEIRRFKVGCTMSHLEIVKRAKENNLKNILIFEDDCMFVEGFKEKAQLCVNELKNVEWDVLYFGGEPNNHCIDISDNLVQINNGGVYCCHAYAVNHTFYDKFLNADPYTVDVIDIFLINYNCGQRKYLLSRDLLALQDTIFSDLKQGPSMVANDYMRGGWDRFVPKRKVN